MTSGYLEYIDEIVKKVKENNDTNGDKIYEAFNLANKAHKNVFRHSGEPYIAHPVMVAKILSEMNVDEITLIAALLHDTVEDTTVSSLEIEEQFGKNVATIVDGVTKISEINFESLEQKQAENYRKLIISMIKDLRVIIIKFADRLHNMRTIEYMKPHKQIQKAKETMEVFAPLAYRLGMFKIKSELEDMAFKVLNPTAYNEIKDQLQIEKDDYHLLLKKIIPEVESILKKKNISCKVSGRIKHYYSIYRKLQTRKESMEQIKDIVALRIVLEKKSYSIDEKIPENFLEPKAKTKCFEVMQLMHRHYKPVKGGISDFLSIPRENGYQSLHTKVIYLGQICEIQIRTAQMHDIAENGLAAHWRYKNLKNDDNSSSSQAIDEYIDKIKNILNQSFESTDPNEVLSDLRNNLTSGEIFVFTPKRELITLSKESTPVDFAYRIHDNVGNHCIAAKVSGRIVPLDTVLETGDIVEIITSANQKPNYEWLNFAKSSKARHCIKNYLKQNQYDRTINLGEEILQGEIHKYRIHLKKLKLEELGNSFGFKKLSDFYYAIGYGEIKPRDFLRKIAKETKSSMLDKVIGKVMFKKKIKGLRLNKVYNKSIKFCKSCNPLPGDEIIGCSKDKNNIIIHRTKCSEIKDITNGDQYDVYWDADKDEFFEVKISIIAENRKNLLKDIIAVISWAKINLQSVNIKNGDGLATGEFIAEVMNLSQYIKIRKKISSIGGVMSVSRNLDIKNM